MSYNDMNTLSQKMKDLREQGFREDFEVKNDKIINRETDFTYFPQEVMLKKVFRFEGDTNPGDESVLYAFETTDGSKGMIIDSFGAKSDTGIEDFVKQANWQVQEKG